VPTLANFNQLHRNMATNQFEAAGKWHPRAAVQHPEILELHQSGADIWRHEGGV
jgi:hypothetical protein